MIDIALRGPVVAIDGPSGAGKSTVARQVARTLGWGYLDTGAMYRLATVWCQRQGIALAEHSQVAACIENMPVRVHTDPGQGRFFLHDEDVTELIRSTEVSARVSQVATNLAARAVLGSWQRRLLAPGHMVAEGRDITTVVAPDATVRILLTASSQARLARRASELHGSASAASLAATRDQVERRDRDDATVVDFFTPAPGVHLIDTSELSIAQAVNTVLELVRAALDG